MHFMGTPCKLDVPYEDLVAHIATPTWYLDQMNADFA